MNTIILKTSLFLLFLMSLSPENAYKEEIEKINTETSYEKTLEINEVNEFFIEKLDNKLEGKKITCLGDSITYGNGGSYKEDGTQISYCDYLADILDAEVVNLGIGGTAIGDYWDENSFILRWNKIPEDSDIIIIYGGLNDYFIGNYGDINTKEEKTFTGDCYKLFSNIKNTYTNSKIYVILNYQTDYENIEQFKNNDLEKYLMTEKQYAEEFGFEIIDLYHLNFLNSKDMTLNKAYIPDGVHPNDEGNKILANEIATKLLIDAQ